MKNSEDEIIKLNNITVHCGRTKLSELLKAGYSVAPEPWEYHAESQTGLYLFYKDREHIGALVFFDLPEAFASSAIRPRPISLVLLNDPSGGKTSVADFFNKIGFPLTKGNTFGLGGFYLFAWLAILFSFIFGGKKKNEKVPIAFTYILLALPPIIFLLLLAAYGLKSFFRMMYQKMSFPGFLLFCFGLFLIWTYINTLALLWLKSSPILYGWVWLLPIVFVLLIAGFAGYHVVCHFIIDRKPPSKVFILYFLIHGFLFFLILGVAYTNRHSSFLSKFLRNTENMVSRYFVIMFVQIFIYSAMTFVSGISYIIGSIFR
jgi:hypothetical protein